MRSTTARAGRRRRALILLALALTAGALAASRVSGSVREVEARVGPTAPVVVAREDLRPGERLDPDVIDRLLTIEEVPASFLPPDSLTAPEEALGLRVAVPVPADGYLTAGHLDAGAGQAAAGPPLAPGERVVEIAAAGGEALSAAGPGSRVDVLVTTAAEGGAGRTYVALERVELLDVRTPGGGATVAGEAGTVAALRVTLEQAVLLTAAQNFAREIRLLPRSPEDTARVGATSVDAADL